MTDPETLALGDAIIKAASNICLGHSRNKVAQAMTLACAAMVKTCAKQGRVAEALSEASAVLDDQAAAERARVMQ